MLYLISYDIRDDKARLRIFKSLKEWGYHIQKSVFIGNCPNPAAATVVFEQLQAMAQQQSDHLLMVPLCHQCFSRRKQFGEILPLDDPVWIF